MMNGTEIAHMLLLFAAVTKIGRIRLLELVQKVKILRNEKDEARFSGRSNDEKKGSFMFNTQTNFHYIFQNSVSH